MGPPKRRQGLYLVYMRYILPIGVIVCYRSHLFPEPEKSVENMLSHNVTECVMNVPNFFGDEYPGLTQNPKRGSKQCTTNFCWYLRVTQWWHIVATFNTRTWTPPNSSYWKYMHLKGCITRSNWNQFLLPSWELSHIPDLSAGTLSQWFFPRWNILVPWRAGTISWHILGDRLIPEQLLWV